MRIEEARWILDEMLALGPEVASPVANIGSSTAEFRRNIQPHIDQCLFEPLLAAGFTVQHVDIKAADGVDIVGDICDPACLDRLRQLGFRSVICSNLLEHIVARDLFARGCEQILPAGGHILVTVPYSYPYHADPIDTMFRPTVAEIAALFPHCSIAAATIVTSATAWADARQRGLRHLLAMPLRSGWRLLNAVRQYDRFRSDIDRYRWMFRPFRIACAHLIVSRDS